MICEAVVKQLPLLLYGELTFDEEEAVHQHLEACAALPVRTDEDDGLAPAPRRSRSGRRSRRCW